MKPLALFLCCVVSCASVWARPDPEVFDDDHLINSIKGNKPVAPSRQLRHNKWNMENYCGSKLRLSPDVEHTVIMKRPLHRCIVTFVAANGYLMILPNQEVPNRNCILERLTISQDTGPTVRYCSSNNKLKPLATNARQATFIFESRSEKRLKPIIIKIRTGSPENLRRKRSAEELEVQTKDTNEAVNGLQLCPKTCGISSAANFDEEITDGRVEYEKFPWFASVIYGEVFFERGYVGEKRCAGTILTSTAVVTAASCLYRKQNETFNHLLPTAVVVGGESEDKEQAIRIDVHWIHPSVKLELPAQDIHDVGLVLLKTNITLGPYAKHICLPPQTAFMDQLVTAVGFAKEDGDNAEDLYRITLRVKDYTECGFSEKPEALDCAVVVRNSDEEECVAIQEAGAPLVTKIDERWHLVGILQTLEGCNDGDLATFQTMFDHTDPLVNFGDVYFPCNE